MTEYNAKLTIQPMEYQNDLVYSNRKILVDEKTVDDMWNLRYSYNNVAISPKDYDTTFLTQSEQKLSNSTHDFFVQWSHAVDLIIKYDNVELCKESELGKFLRKCLNIYRDNGTAVNLIIKYYQKNAANNSRVIALLHALGHMEYSEVEMAGFAVAAMCLTNKNIEVVEYAIKAFENWNSIDTLDFLENVNTSSIWLGRYLEGVIEDIKESNVDVGVC